MHSMTQEERVEYLIDRLCHANPHYLPDRSFYKASRKDFLRALLNVRHPDPIDEEFLQVQDAYLQEETASKGITDAADLKPVRGDIALWKGDITTLKCDAIVNAANSNMTGCYRPCHNCIDNCIHTYAGVQLRLECDGIMRRQGHPEPVGTAKITDGYNLPCRKILHTVGPAVDFAVTEEDQRLLASCYRTCLDLAFENHLESVAFCCISTGVFHYPPEEAAKVAVETVCDWKEQNHSPMKIIFTVHGERNYRIYQEILQ